MASAAAVHTGNIYTLSTRYPRTAAETIHERTESELEYRVEQHHRQGNPNRIFSFGVHWLLGIGETRIEDEEDERGWKNSRREVVAYTYSYVDCLYTQFYTYTYVNCASLRDVP